jgi:hypothetical protein
MRTQKLRRFPLFALAAVLASVVSIPSHAAERADVAPFDEFQSAPRKANFRLDPISPLFGQPIFKQWGASIDFPIGSAFTIGPSLRGGPSFISGDSYALIYRYGITAGLYLNGTRLTDSFVVWPSWFFGSFNINHGEGGQPILGDFKAKEVGLIGGYQWFFDGGWNVNFGLGLKYRMQTSNVAIVVPPAGVVTSDLSNGVSFASELMVGWAIQ